MEKFFTAVLVTIGLVVLHEVATPQTVETVSSEIVLSEISWQKSTLLQRKTQ